LNALAHDTFDHLPAEMRLAPRWLVWKLIPPKTDGKKPRKVPYYASGAPRGGGALDTPEDMSKLAAFDAARVALAAGGYTGLGFALGPDGSGQVWQGVDLDKLEEHQELRDVVQCLPGYVERSPSGEGLHVMGYGRAFEALGPNASGIEAYSAGRYFTVTGRRYRHAGDGVLADIADFVETDLRPLHGGNKAEKAQAPASGPAETIVTPQLLAEIRDALGYIEAHDYNTWIRIGHALKALGEPGLEIWHDWSATSVTYNDDEADDKWKGFKPQRTGHRAIFAEAQRCGWRNPRTRANTTDNASAGHTEEALALAFARENEAALRYCAAWGQWFTWDGVRWAVDKTLLATDWVRDLCRRAAASFGSAGDGKELARARTVSAVERLARTDRRLAATVEQWDADPWLLNTPGGVVDLRTGEVSPCDPALHITKVTAAAPSGECPTWLRFLDRITGSDTDLQAYIQRVLGYALTGDTSAHALFFGYGTGANGKSVLIDTVAGILGDYHKTAPIETFTESLRDRHPTELAMLRGARLVTAVETEEGRRWAESRIKTLTGGDRVAARFMGQDFFEYTPQFKLFVAGNHKPGLRSVDEAMRRRFHMVPFAVTIPKPERDDKLTAKLRSEWPGILTWMVEGCLQWQRAGLAPPAAVLAATEAYLEGEDALAAWIAEQCVEDPQAWTSTGDLFGSWKSWAAQRGEPVSSSKWLVQALESRDFALRRTAQARGVQGLRLKDTASIDAGVQE
jgi:putative DNA primase/helicase